VRGQAKRVPPSVVNGYQDFLAKNTATKGKEDFEKFGDRYMRILSCKNKKP
jgi:hypothetical protein